MDQDAMDIDPAIAEAMGFSGFGMQTKKRKHGADDAFVATSSESSVSKSADTHPATGSNVTTKVQQPVTSAEEPQQKAIPTNADGKPTLEALRRGVPNAQGDMTYFLPSFIEDPWKDLVPR